jgi:ribokinase
MGGKVTVIGSYNTGFVIYIDRMPSLGETVRGWGFRMEHGGKGSNQAVQAARLGSETAIVARVGNDVFGERALRLWRSESISTDHVRIDQDAPTGAGLVIVGPEGKNLIAVDLGANMRLSEEDVDSAEPLLRRSDVVLAQLEIPDRVALYALRLSEGIKVLNPAPAVRMEPEQLSGIDVITPNEVEMRLMSGEDQNSDVAAIAERYAKYTNVVVTLGERGALVVEKGGRRYTVPAPRVRAVDTTGAGDAFNGALASALARGYSLREAVELACRAGAFLVTRRKGPSLIDSLPDWRDLEALEVL